MIARRASLLVVVAFACTGKYDPLPAGTYTFRIVVSGPTPKPAPVTLTVSW